MALSIDDIKKIAHLARIEVSESEAQATLSKLTGIMGLIEQMQAVDTTGIEPMSHSQDLTQRLRDDVVTKENLRAEFQKNAPALGNGSNEPAVAEGLYLVPKVIE
ncbi:MAG: Asp-tRNA(Asn)/Glu-tRNA(Gln) amidotransferase subunit GatC [Methylotenera sp.]|nr:Asp-tRNA(Asn)/Glu-tRNA(Gln) amidotransferase subunit GatC [Methylotenera sp.]